MFTPHKINISLPWNLVKKKNSQYLPSCPQDQLKCFRTTKVNSRIQVFITFPGD